MTTAADQISIRFEPDYDEIFGAGTDLIEAVRNAVCIRPHNVALVPDSLSDDRRGWVKVYTPAGSALIGRYELAGEPDRSPHTSQVRT
ncbi:MAG: hypothetical protein OXT70_01240 [Chloroflexota bacterium]|nr:hypothetical protein [Chloroflexota bacterium]